MRDTDGPEMEKFIEIMSRFGAASGLQINPTKSRLWFSKGCNEQTVLRVKNIWRAEEAEHSEKYLGVMVGGRGCAKRNGNMLLEKLKQKLAGWKSNMLSHAGRLVMIKSVLTSIPVYYMGMEMLPKGTIKEMNSLLAKFFWGKTGQARYLSFIAWTRVCKPMENGGLGVKQLQIFGEALFLKVVWSLMADDNKLWVQICKAKYFPTVGYWRARDVTGGSSMWRQILRMREFFKQHVSWQVGKGDKVNALSQPSLLENRS